MRPRKRSVAKMSIMVALIVVCSWVTLPFGAVPFTLQTLGVMMALIILGGKNGAIVISVYLLLGAVGLPVFSAFGGGVGVLLGPTGGFLIGFLFGSLAYLLFERMNIKKTKKYIGAAAFLITCYTFGCVYYSIFTEVSIITAISVCVLPYIITDILKIVLAVTVGDRIVRYL